MPSTIDSRRQVTWRAAFLGFTCAMSSMPSAAQVPGMAIELDGDNDYVATDRLFGQPTAFTIAAWVKIDSGTPGLQATIVGNHGHGIRWESVELKSSVFGLNPTNSNLTRQSLVFPAVNDGTWHHLAAVWDGSSQWVYVDGALAAGPQAAPLGPWASPGHLWIGGRESNIVPPLFNDTPGLIDEVQIWNVARSQEQIETLMHSALGPQYTASPDSGLVGYWRFEETLDLGYGNPGVNDFRDLSSVQGVGDFVGGTLVSTGTVDAPLTGPATGARSVQLTAFPNPFVAGVRLGATEPLAEVAVFDLAGRRVASFQPHGRNTAQLAWNGTDRSGAPVSPGVYLVRAATISGKSATARLVRIR